MNAHDRDYSYYQEDYEIKEKKVITYGIVAFEPDAHSSEHLIETPIVPFRKDPSVWVPWESAKWGDTDELSEEEFNKDVLAGLERYCIENCRHVNVYKYTRTFWWDISR